VQATSRRSSPASASASRRLLRSAVSTSSRAPVAHRWLGWCVDLSQTEWQARSGWHYEQRTASSASLATARNPLSSPNGGLDLGNGWAFSCRFITLPGPRQCWPRSRCASKGPDAARRTRWGYSRQSPCTAPRPTPRTCVKRRAWWQREALQLRVIGPRLAHCARAVTSTTERWRTTVNTFPCTHRERTVAVLGSSQGR